MGIINYLSKEILGYTQDEINELHSKNERLQEELKKLPLFEQYRYGLFNKKGFCIKNTVYEEKQINNSFNRLPILDNNSNLTLIIGGDGSGKSTLTRNISSNSKKILFFGSMEKNEFDIKERRFYLENNNDIPKLITHENESYFTHEIDFYRVPIKDVINIDFSTHKIDKNKDLESFSMVMETLIFKAITNDYTIIFDEKYIGLDYFFKTNIFSELIVLAYDKLSCNLAYNNHISTSESKLFIKTNLIQVEKILFKNIDCSQYLDEVIIMDYKDKYQKVHEQQYTFLLGDYFKYNPIKVSTKIGDFIHFQKK